METKLIYTAINAAMKQVGHIGKEKKNVQQNFMFRGIDQVMNTMKSVLEDNGIFIVPEVIDTQREERTTKSGGTLIYTVHKIKYHFIATDGSEVCATVIGEGMDSADKSSNKAMAVAFKYACFQVFCIPTEEMAKDDPDAYSPEESTKAQPQQRQQAAPQPNEMAAKRKEVTDFLNNLDPTTRKQWIDYFGIADYTRMTDQEIVKVWNYRHNNAQKK